MALGNTNLGFSSGSGGGGGGGVTSVGLSMPAAFSVANSPVTGAGTLAVSGAGSASQYVRGDGTLGDFPNVGGGAGSQIFYFNGSVSQGTIGGVASYQMSRTANTGAAANLSVTGDNFLAQFITDIGSPNQLLIPAGVWQFSAYFSSSNNSGTPAVYALIQKWDGTSYTTLATSTNEVLTNGTAVDLYNFTAAVPDTALLATDRIVVKFYTISTGGRTITLYTQGANLSFVTTTFPNGISSLNGLTANTQYFQCTTLGTDFTIVSSGNTHCFNLPTASCTNRGALSAADWCRFNNATTYCFGTSCSILPVNGGNSNVSPCSVISGGVSNSINSSGGVNNIIGGGNSNSLAGFGYPVNSSGIFSGESNYMNNYQSGGAAMNYTFIGGGTGNSFTNPTFGRNTSWGAIVGGANHNLSNVQFSTIAGGNSNGISWSDYSFIGSGVSNSIASYYLYPSMYSGIVSGQSNSISSSPYSFIGGGCGNSVNVGSASYSSILGGATNCITQSFASILGGNNNTISSIYGVALGGQCNTITGLYSGVANLCGVNASADCTFYFCNLCVLGTISGGGGATTVFCNGASGTVNAASVAGTTYYFEFTSAGTLVLPTAVGNTSIYKLKNRASVNIVACFTGGQNADGSTCISLIPFQALEFVPNNSNFNIF